MNPHKNPQKHPNQTRKKEKKEKKKKKKLTKQDPQQPTALTRKFKFKPTSNQQPTPLPRPRLCCYSSPCLTPLLHQLPMPLLRQHPTPSKKNTNATTGKTTPPLPNSQCPLHAAATPLLNFYLTPNTLCQTPNAHSKLLLLLSLSSISHPIPSATLHNQQVFNLTPPNTLCQTPSAHSMLLLLLSSSSNSHPIPSAKLHNQQVFNLTPRIRTPTEHRPPAGTPPNKW
ncbi:unnamed protein product [Camellia sinensis]